jgi:hypothetical protein
MGSTAGVGILGVATVTTTDRTITGTATIIGTIDGATIIIRTIDGVTVTVTNTVHQRGSSVITDTR